MTGRIKYVFSTFHTLIILHILCFPIHCFHSVTKLCLMYHKSLTDIPGRNRLKMVSFFFEIMIYFCRTWLCIDFKKHFLSPTQYSESSQWNTIKNVQMWDMYNNMISSGIAWPQVWSYCAKACELDAQQDTQANSRLVCHYLSVVTCQFVISENNEVEHELTAAEFVILETIVQCCTNLDLKVMKKMWSNFWQKNFKIWTLLTRLKSVY